MHCYTLYSYAAHLGGLFVKLKGIGPKYAEFIRYPCRGYFIVAVGINFRIDPNGDIGARTKAYCGLIYGFKLFGGFYIDLFDIVLYGKADILFGFSYAGIYYFAARDAAFKRQKQLPAAYDISPCAAGSQSFDYGNIGIGFNCVADCCLRKNPFKLCEVILQCFFAVTIKRRTYFFGNIHYVYIFHI